MDHVEVNIHEDDEEIARITSQTPKWVDWIRLCLRLPSQTPPITSEIHSEPSTSQTPPVPSEIHSEPITSHTPTTTGTANLATSQPCIYRVPDCYRKDSPHYFTPAVVSFGPFHYDTGDHLRAMEAQKQRVLYEILHSLEAENSNIIEQSLLTAMRDELPPLLRCYAGFEWLWSGDEEYIHILMRRHRVDTIADRIVKDGVRKELDGRCQGVNQLVRKELERLVCQVVMEGVEEFAHLLVNKVDGDEFVRFMVRGDDVGRLMVRHGVKYLVRDNVRRRLPESDLASSRIEELAPDMVRESIEEFTRRLVRDGLDAFARLMVRDGIFQISLMVAAARKVATDAARNAADAARKAAVAARKIAVAARNAADAARKAAVAARNFADCPLFEFARGCQFRDNVFGNKASKEIWDYIQTDILLIENQIPMQVLRILLGKLSPSVQLQAEELHSHVLQFITYPHQLNTNNSPERDCNPCREQPLRLHILDYYKDARTNGESPCYVEIPSARTLYFSGVNIKLGESPFYDEISLKHDTLCIPNIPLHDHEAACILNLLAFEHLHEDTDYEVTNYVVIMAKLVRKPLHVKILQALYSIHLSNAWTNDEVSRFFQLAGRFDPLITTKSPPMKGCMWPFTTNPLLWPNTCYRFFILLLVEDRGKSINYIALAFALMTWLCTLLLTILLKK